ncbi:MAG TPA: DUF4870 domain-containing protein [Pyrinomonadaceae bacterium]|nr:DUF4870 domain-containing protein [Pyrinomonadaceae bacterium]
MQNPPPGQQQQGYGSPYGTPPNAPMTQPPGGGNDGPKGKTALGGLEANLAAALGYPIGIIALVMVIIEKQNRFARFHALQSLLLIAGWIVLFVVLSILIGVLSAISEAFAFIGLLVPLIWLAWFAALIFSAYKAYQGEWFKLPVIGNIAENFARK